MRIKKRTNILSVYERVLLTNHAYMRQEYKSMQCRAANNTRFVIQNEINLHFGRSGLPNESRDMFKLRLLSYQ